MKLDKRKRDDKHEKGKHKMYFCTVMEYFFSITDVAKIPTYLRHTKRCISFIFMGITPHSSFFKICIFVC